MTSGYPKNYRPVARAVAVAARYPVATGVARSAISIPNAAMLRGWPKVPAPHPALLIGAASALALGYALKWYQGANPPASTPGKSNISSALTLWGGWQGGVSEAPYTWVGTGAGEQAFRSPFQDIDYKYALFEPDDIITNLPDSWHKIVDAPPVVFPPYSGNIYGTPMLAVTTNIWRKYNGYAQWEYLRRKDFYYNATAEAQEVRPIGPAVIHAPPLAPASRPPSAPAEAYDNGVRVPFGLWWAVPKTIQPDWYYEPAKTRPAAFPFASGAANVRGVGTQVGVGTIASPMTPMREVKAAATAKTMKLISQTLGQLGEAFDATRCIMYATGNTYFGRDGKERAIPKRRWLEAMEELSGNLGPRVKRGSARHMNAVFRDGSFITHDNRIISAKDAAARLAGCLVVNWFEDLVVAKQSQIIRDWQNKFGLTIGPFGVQSLTKLLQGEVAYEGLFDFNL